jgi:co-chaperonin GroES (HSP10)
MIQPIGARLLVKRIEQAKPETQHIIIPETIEQKSSAFAAVFAIGTLKQDGIEVGDIVILMDYVGAPANVTLPGDETETECLIVNEDDVLAVVHGI